MTSAPPVYLDCDTGIDDALAIAYLIARQANLVGIGTVSGNIDAGTAARNTLDLLSLLGAPDIPVAVGECHFLTREFPGGPVHVHGRNGIGDVVLPTSAQSPVAVSGPELLIDLARKYPNQLRVLAIGPLTNLAVALTKEPDLEHLVADVTIMGGAAAAPGNVSAVAEANIANDPEAAALVLRAAWNTTLVPLDVTMPQRITRAQADKLRSTRDPALTALAEMLSCYLAFYSGRFGDDVAALHDPLAAAIMLGDVPLASGPRLPVHVDETNGPGRGQTIIDRRDTYLGYPRQDHSGVRVALGTTAPFGEYLIDTLIAMRRIAPRSS